MKKTSFEDVLILSGIRTARFLVQTLPYRICLRLGSFIGDVAYATTKRRPVMTKNLRAVFAAEKTPRQMDQIARESFRNVGRTGIELLKAPDMDRAFIEKRVRVIGREKIDRALQEGKGVIFLTAHFGSWELLNISAGLFGYPMTALAREQKHPRSDAYLNDLRRSTGNQVIYKGMPIREILRALKAGRIVGILSDQDGGRGGLFVPFFGRLSSYPKGVASFALRTSAPIFPTFIFREKGENHRIEVEGPLHADSEAGILEQFAKILETKIRKDPGQWLWAHRRWKSSPDRFVVVLSDGKAGHRNQSLAFYDAIFRERTALGLPDGTTHLKVIEIRFKSEMAGKCFRALHQIFRGRVPFARFWAKKFLVPQTYREIMETYADIVISAGSLAAGVNLWCAKENAAKPVVIMDPGFGLEPFHTVIAPKHDRLRKSARVFETHGALTRISKEGLRYQAQILKDQLGLTPQAKVVGFLAGGDTSEIRFEPSLFLTAADQILEASKAAGLTILATTSRRTPAWADAAMKEKFEKNKMCSFLVIANTVNPPEAVQGILGLADIVVVSGESISMVSEAAASGKKVLVIEPFKSSALKPKHQRFLNDMEQGGRVRRVSVEDLGGQIRSALDTTTPGVEGDGMSEDSQRLCEAARKIIG